MLLKGEWNTFASLACFVLPSDPYDTMSLVTEVIVGNEERECAKLGNAAMEADCALYVLLDDMFVELE